MRSGTQPAVMMQYIESSVIGIRSAVITLKRRTTPLQFVVFPMVHVAEPEFYSGVAAMAGECDLIVAEGAPSRYAPMQRWMSRFRLDDLVDQLDGLDLEALAVPVQWEYVAPDRERSGLEQAGDKAVDAAAAVVLRVLGRYGSPLGVPSLEQSDEHDDRWERRDSGRLARAFEDTVLHARDAQLVRALGAIHRERYTEAIKVAVVFGAAHIPAVVDSLGEDLRYQVVHAEWLVVAHATD
jgi:hypothetical protein